MRETLKNSATRRLDPFLRGSSRIRSVGEYEDPAKKWNRVSLWGGDTRFRMNMVREVQSQILNEQRIYTGLIYLQSNPLRVPKSLLFEAKYFRIYR
jgi:hypothetical protein